MSKILSDIGSLISSSKENIGAKLVPIGLALGLISLIALSIGIVNYYEAQNYDHAFHWIPLSSTQEMISDKYAIAKDLYVAGALGLGGSLTIFLLGKSFSSKKEERTSYLSYLFKAIAVLSTIIALSLLIQSEIHHKEALMIDQEMTKLSPELQFLFKGLSPGEYALADNLLYAGLGTLGGALLLGCIHKKIKKSEKTDSEDKSSFWKQVLHTIALISTILACISCAEAIIHHHDALFLKDTFGSLHFLIDGIIDLEEGGSQLLFEIGVGAIGGGIIAALLANKKNSLNSSSESVGQVSQAKAS